MDTQLHETEPAAGGVQGFGTLQAAVEQVNVTAPELPPEPAGEKKPVKLGTKHREHIHYLVSKGLAEWDEEKHLLNTHTVHVEKLHVAFKMPGEFETDATGKDGTKDRNCCMIPTPRGCWEVIRYGGAADFGDLGRKNLNGNYCTVIGKAPPKPKIDHADTIVSDALETDTLFNWQGTGYVELSRHGKRENLLVGSEKYRRLLRVRYRKAHGLVAKAEWIKNATDQLIAIALEESPELPVYVRQAYVGKKLYIDLSDRAGTIIEIDADDYRPVTVAPVRFLRSDKMLPLPIPQDGGTLEDLREFVNITDEDFPLLVGAIIGMLHPTGPYAVVNLIGGDGRAKTCLAKVIQQLIDPSVIEGCSPPESVEDLVLAVQQRWLLFIDNASELRQWLSDAHCRLSTGGSIERRTLYTNSDTSAFTAKRPQLLTSICDVIKSPDLVSRTIKFDLPRVQNHKGEAELFEDFDKARPKILGAIYRAVAAAIKNRPNIKIDNLPRLADLCIWMQAAEPATGLAKAKADEGIILRAYAEARSAAVNELLSSDVARKIIDFAPVKEWRGTGKQLAKDSKVDFSTDKQVQDFVAELRTLQTALESEGVLVGLRKSHGKKLITLKKL